MNKNLWYKSKLFWSTVSLIGLWTTISIGGSANVPTSIPSIYQDAAAVRGLSIVPQSSAETTTYVPNNETKTVIPRSEDDSRLSNNNYYTNSAGNRVHSPAFSQTVPVGASAQCRDGTYSFSQSRRGTCSHHGGVAEWL